MMRKKITIVAEGGASMGMGHIMRMLELARVLKKDVDVSFLSRSSERNNALYQAGIDKVQKSGFEVAVYSVEKLVDLLPYVSADLLLIDSYDVTEEFFVYANKIVPVTAYMDDEKIIPIIDANIVINQNIYGCDITYESSKTILKLLGIDYLILRDEFVDNPPKIIQEDIKRIMITLGGSDNHNYTETILKQLYTQNYHIRIVIGPAFAHSNTLEKYRSSKMELCYDAKMSEIMNWCDIAITSCGSTAYEILAMGVPAIGLAVADNQIDLINYLSQKDLMLKGDLYDINSALKKLTYDKRKNISKAAQKCVDGRGKKRIAANLLGMIR